MKQYELSNQEKEYLNDCIKNGREIPLDFKYKLFPTNQKEYELAYAGKMRKEDLLTDEDGISAVPLQIEKIFNGVRTPLNGSWRNMIVFGDNLQFLKTVYKNEDPIIKGVVKGKIKLIYIDPPFGTGDEYDGNNGQPAYSAKTKGADFVEFIRRRIIVLHEILADDGVLMVRQGYNFGHYIKIILDEVFGKSFFINEIIVNRGAQAIGGSKKFSTASDSIYVYSKTSNYQFFAYKRPRYPHEPKASNFYMKGDRNPPERTFIDPEGNKVVLLPPKGQHWKFIQKKIDQMYDNDIIYLAIHDEEKDIGIRKLENGKEIDVNYAPRFYFDTDKAINSLWTDIAGYTKSKIYPTENSEHLLLRAIESFTAPGDLILDCFAGSGSAAAVAEKTGRKWIVCDIGKYSFYTMQKRILQIQNSKQLENPQKKYGKVAKSFVTVNTGLYDLPKLFELQKEEYCHFVMDLFEVYPQKKTINGITIHGERKDGYDVLIWEYWKFDDAAVDKLFLDHLHSVIGNRVGERLYIIAPANRVQFIDDYFQIAQVKYYFLKVPYQVIQELHKTKFKKFRQPTSINNVNTLDDAVGFHFIRQPEVNSSFSDGVLSITKFLAHYPDEETGKEMSEFKALALVIIDKDYDGKEFVMSDAFFAEELVTKKSGVINIELTGYGKKIGVVYIDIYGNEFREEIITGS